MKNNLWFLPKRPGTIRILFHTINHVGLGHVNRSVAVAQWLTTEIPDVQVLFLTEGGESLIERAGFPWILIPSQSTESEHCEQIARTVLNVFRPTLSIHESVLRECLHRPVKEEGVKQVLMGSMGGGVMRDQFQSGLSSVEEVDLVIVLQRKEEVIPLDQVLIAQYKGPIVYAGPLLRRKNRIPGNDLRQRLGLSDEHKVIFLTFGGGSTSTARELLSSTLAAKAHILERFPQAKLIVISGPYFTDPLPENDEFVCYTSHFEPFLTDYLDIASAVICMAGYNTVNEVVASGLPAVCVPTPEAPDQVGAGNMGEYARTFPNVVLSSTNPEELTQHLIDALGGERDISVVRLFQQRAEDACLRIVDEIKSVLNYTGRRSVGIQQKVT